MTTGSSLQITLTGELKDNVYKSLAKWRNNLEFKRGVVLAQRDRFAKEARDDGGVVIANHFAR